MIFNANGTVSAGNGTSTSPTAQQIAVEIAKIQAATPPKVTSQNLAPTYKANPFTTAQLGQIPYQASPSMLQAYQSKMQGMGVTPQPFTPSVSAPQKGGK